MLQRRLGSASICLCLLALLPASARAQDATWSQSALEQVTREIEAQVESLRGHQFVRPTAVRSADRATFLKYVLDRNDEQRSAQEQAADQALARHLGLIPADMDLMKTTLALLEDQVGGFYSPGDDTFYLMESFTGGLAKVILAHELTHALDDQLYDLDAPFAQRKDSSDALLAYSALVEGSGTNVMNRWTMSHRDQLSNEDLLAASSMGAAGLADAPPYLWKPLMAAYLKGEAFLLAGYKALKRTAEKGAERPSINDAIDKAFAAPPASMEQVLHPEKYWDEQQRDEPSRVRHELAGLPQAWRLAADDTLGELALALMTQPIEERGGLDMSNPLAILGVQYTSPAAAGWDGDEVVLLTREGASVLQLATCWDSARDASEFRAAMEPLMPGLAARQAELLAAGSQSGWSLRPGADESQLALVLWAGCEPVELEALLEGALAWSVERK